MYMHISFSVEEHSITVTDRAHPTDGLHRIVNLDIGPLSLMIGGATEAKTAETCERLMNAVSRLHAASLARLAEEAELEARDNQIDAGLGTGYIGEFR